jgi:hypothetical protein
VFDGGGDVLGCTDSNACNYDAEATDDDGSCEYAQENFDCDGNCVVETDCSGECGGDAVVDNCGECNGDGSSCQTSSIEISYSSDADIAGFQFGLDNLVIVGASGGDAEANGFMVSSSATTVIGFSLTGSVIPAGSGVLTTLEVEGDVDDGCIIDLVLSGSDGEALDFTIENCLSIVVIGGCTDIEACNYDENADVDDDSCEYAEDNFDCDGNCTAEVDCAGECGGDAILDDCGVCDGDGTSCQETLSLSLDSLSGNMLVHMENNVDVAGFQFSISDIDINGVSGGSSADNGFTVSGLNETVIGFSLTGAVIPPGDGVLVEIDYTALWDEACLGEVVLSDANGGSISWITDDCIALYFEHTHSYHHQY